jgi:hypothetical protein
MSLPGTLYAGSTRCGDARGLRPVRALTDGRSRNCWDAALPTRRACHVYAVFTLYVDQHERRFVTRQMATLAANGCQELLVVLAQV